MALLDCLLLTLANMVLCITLPKLLCLLLAAKDSQAEQSEPALKPQVAESELPIFL